ncbi:1,4-dihydroxy-2-naphthoate octaprenyltransferase [Dyadobacter jejuensis]|uniref:1,4-dihydroxy-2-naphthoate octaprenyltransferase n=1 Tax=Dyadobacter jejuensis TaxID=1082580 RepID=A0A316ANN9_9BACT|nr:UbiA family prenyltransferase [Dyadobacter jejuensis]PWJ59078.1 1,4-dihydroxy-2-naphthoate octaprenyltransferase [Dyadobacter jejuensis]
MQQLQNTVKLLRIPFSFFLMPLFLFALSQAPSVNWVKAITAFSIIHFLVYPASNGYNSYIDRDEGSIGGLENPPMPTIWLFYLTLAMDLVAVLLAYWYVSPEFALCIIVYILASRAYSSRLIRLKKYAFGGFLTVMLFQGAFTYLMATVGVIGSWPTFNNAFKLVLLACSLQIGGAYPLTQIYQHQADLADGVVTLSYKLGYRGTFLFTGAMFALSNLCYFLYFQRMGTGMVFYLLISFFMPIIVYYIYWMRLVWQNEYFANFTHTMRMNALAAWCMNSFFIFLIVIRYFL